MLKNVTLSAEENLIKNARQKASREHQTLNALFRQWLRAYVNAPASPEAYDELMRSFSYANAGKRFSREELNER